MRRLVASLLTCGVLSMSLGLATFVVPTPVRTLPLSPFDFKYVWPTGSCLYSTPFSGRAGEAFSGSLHLYWLWNDTIVESRNGTPTLVHADDAMQSACSGTFSGSRFPSDGQYLIMVFDSNPMWINNRPVNATLIVEGAVIITDPAAYLPLQLGLAGATVVFWSLGYVLARRANTAGPETGKVR